MIVGLPGHANLPVEWRSKGVTFYRTGKVVFADEVIDWGTAKSDTRACDYFIQYRYVEITTPGTCYVPLPSYPCHVYVRYKGSGTINGKAVSDLGWCYLGIASDEIEVTINPDGTLQINCFVATPVLPFRIEWKADSDKRLQLLDKDGNLVLSPHRPAVEVVTMDGMHYNLYDLIPGWIYEEVEECGPYYIRVRGKWCGKTIYVEFLYGLFGYRVIGAEFLLAQHDDQAYPYCKVAADYFGAFDFDYYSFVKSEWANPGRQEAVWRFMHWYSSDTELQGLGVLTSRYFDHNPTVVDDEDWTDWTVSAVGSGEIDLDVHGTHTPAVVGSKCKYVRAKSGTYDRILVEKSGSWSVDPEGVVTLYIFVSKFEQGAWISISLAAPDWDNSIRYSIVCDWVGWRRLILPLKSPDSVYGSPDYSNITTFRIALHIKPGMEIRIDRITFDELKEYTFHLDYSPFATIYDSKGVCDLNDLWFVDGKYHLSDFTSTRPTITEKWAGCDYVPGIEYKVKLPPADPAAQLAAFEYTFSKSLPEFSEMTIVSNWIQIETDTWHFKPGDFGYTNTKTHKCSPTLSYWAAEAAQIIRWRNDGSVEQWKKNLKGEWKCTTLTWTQGDGKENIPASSWVKVGYVPGQMLLIYKRWLSDSEFDNPPLDDPDLVFCMMNLTGTFLRESTSGLDYKHVDMPEIVHNRWLSETWYKPSTAIYLRYKWPTGFINATTPRTYVPAYSSYVIGGPNVKLTHGNVNVERSGDQVTVTIGSETQTFEVCSEQFDVHIRAGYVTICGVTKHFDTSPSYSAYKVTVENASVLDVNDDLYFARGYIAQPLESCSITSDANGYVWRARCLYHDNAIQWYHQRSKLTLNLYMYAGKSSTNYWYVYTKCYDKALGCIKCQDFAVIMRWKYLGYSWTLPCLYLYWYPRISPGGVVR